MTDICYAWIPVGEAQGIPFSMKDCRSTKTPAIYRWAFFKCGVAFPVKVYVGETENLSRRIGQYTKPHRTQQTNFEVHDEIEKSIKDGFKVWLEILKIEPVMINRVNLCNENLCDPFVREMIENFVLADIDTAYCVVLNIAENRISRRRRKAVKNNPFADTMRAQGLDVD